VVSEPAPEKVVEKVVEKVAEKVAEKVEPKKEEPLSDQQDSGFEVLDASLQKPELNIKGKPTEVKEDYFDSNPSLSEDPSPKKRPDVIGIKGFYEDRNDQPEIESPMRKKKMGLG
jgi:hypothetical protein